MLNNLSELHFANPYYLLALLLTPIILLISLKKREENLNLYKEFADKYFLNFLRISYHKSTNTPFLLLKILLCLITVFLIMSLAGLRGGKQEIQSFTNREKLVIALDLSHSMNAKDIYPSRLKYIKTELSNSLKQGNFDYEIALIAYANAAYILYPFSKDYVALAELIESLSSELIQLQGSNIEAALTQSYRLLKNNHASRANIILITDGSYELPAYQRLEKLAQEKLNLTIIGIGTAEGSPIADEKGNFIQENGRNLIAKLDKKRLNELRDIFAAKLEIADNNSFSLQEILEENLNNKSAINNENTIIIYQEYFQIFVLIALILMLPFFRKGFLNILIIIGALTFTKPAEANIFLSQDQNALKEYNKQNYAVSEELFTDNYNKGVSAYKNKNYQQAREYFKQSKQDVTSIFNLGNSNLLTNNIEQAIANYEQILKDNPDHQKAQKNLKIAKELLEKKQQQQQKDKQDKKQDSEQKKQAQDQAEKQENQQENQEENKQTENKKKPESGQEKKSASENTPSANEQNILDMIDAGNKKMLQHKIKQQDNQKQNQASQIRPW